MDRPPARSPETPTAALLQAVLRGEAEAIDAWFRAEHAAVHRLCFGFLAHAAEAEDAAQDAMLHLMDHLHAYDPRRSYRAWRNTVVLNLCRSRRRGSEARRRAEGAVAAACPPGVLPDPARDLEQDEVRETLRRSLAALSPREREAFVLRDLEGRATREVAAAMAVTEGTVRSLLTLARRRLRGLLGPCLDPAGCDEGGAFGV